MQPVKLVYHLCKRESPRTSPDPKSVNDHCARLDGVKENTSDPIVSKLLDSPISRPVNENSPILPARQETTPGKTTGYGRGHFET